MKPRLNPYQVAPDTINALRALVGRHVSKSKVAKAPSVGEITIHKWEVSWHVVGRMHKAQGQALIRLLHLIERLPEGRSKRSRIGCE